MYSLNVYYFMLVLYTVLDFQMNIFKRSIICFEVTARLGNYQLWRKNMDPNQLHVQCTITIKKRVDYFWKIKINFQEINTYKVQVPISGREQQDKHCYLMYLTIQQRKSNLIKWNENQEFSYFSHKEVHGENNPLLSAEEIQSYPNIWLNMNPITE